MTVADLIDELKKYSPHLPVKVMLSEVYGGFNDSGEFVDDMRIPLTKEDALDADVVRHEGNHVLIESK